MKIRIKRDILVEVEKPRLEEFWDKQYLKWTEILAEDVTYYGKIATIKTMEGDLLLDIPVDAFEVMK